VAAGKQLNRDPKQWALTGGEDHHILATFPTAGAVPTGWTIIGDVRVGSGVTVDGVAPTELGWDHFAG
jgi:thiamine-monophosphate kinase